MANVGLCDKQLELNITVFFPFTSFRTIINMVKGELLYQKKKDMQRHLH